MKLSTRKKNSEARGKSPKPCCGLCGYIGKRLAKTDCCGNWICDDEDDYVLFSYARNSCSRNHRRFTLCGGHHSEGHAGDWETCKKCLQSLKHELEMYVWYGTNEYNFKKLKNPPAFKPTHCSKCGEIIPLADGGYSVFCDAYRCDACPISDAEREDIIRAYKKKK